MTILRDAIAVGVSLILLFISACAPSSALSPNTFPDLVWTSTSSSSHRGVALIVPGLNVCPHGMGELAVAFNALGFDVLTVPLVGQSSSGDDDIDPTAEIWIAQVTAAYARAREQAKGGMVVGVGYSLGAALLVDLLNSSPEIRFDRMVLLAPAVSLTCSTSPARVLLPLRFFGAALPSLAPERLRCAAWTSLQSYSALFEAVDSAGEVTSPSTLRSTPLLIAMSRDDELISFQGVANWIKKNGLAGVSLVELAPSPVSSDNFAHTIIDSQGLGVSEWRELLGMIGLFLAEPVN